MKNSFDKLLRDQIQADLDNPEALVKKQLPRNGWIHAIRSAIGMSTRQLAKLMHVSQSNVIRLEKSEKMSTITLNSLHEVANAMNCKLVYFLMPDDSFDVMLKKQAQKKAKEQVSIISHSMKLENQGLNPVQIKDQENEIIKYLLENPNKL